jgi:hypothetical protein
LARLQTCPGGTTIRELVGELSAALENEADPTLENEATGS